MPSLEGCDFGRRVWDWWVAIQPEGRLAIQPESGLAHGPLNRGCAYVWEWSDVSRRGPNGIYLVLLAMAWWGLSLQNTDVLTVWLDAIGDLRWALQQMATRTTHQR
jgi:hypothetical protein